MMDKSDVSDDSRPSTSLASEPTEGLASVAGRFTPTPPSIASEHPLDEAQLKNLIQYAVQVHMHGSNIYLNMLRGMSEPYGSEKNPHPWKTLKEGSYYLGNAYRLVQVYKDCVPGPIDDKNIQSVHDTLVDLEFDPKHISRGYTEEAYGGETECFVSKGQGTKYYEILHSELKKDIRSFLEMVQLNIDIPVKRFIETINQKLQSLVRNKQFLEAIKNGNFLTVENCIKKGVDVNFRDTDGRTPLHYAVNSGKIDVVNSLLKNGAKVRQMTNKGNTPLHTASFKGYREIVEVLLQHVSCDEMKDFIDAKTTSSGTTSLHVAAENGFLEIVKSLLTRGATYNITNKEGKMPIDLCKDNKIRNLLKLIEELFRNVNNDNVEFMRELRRVESDEYFPITNARNNRGLTLLDVSNDRNLNILLKMKEPDQSQLDARREFDQIVKLKSAAEVHISFSELYLPILESMSHPYGSEKNTFPWKTLKEGSYYLVSAYRFVQAFQDYVPGPINNNNIKSVYDMLLELEFEPEHIESWYTDATYGTEAKRFVTKGHDKKYFKLLHSELKKDVRLFIEMVTFNIDIPVKRFLESIN